jgi:hypothetical protein
MVEDWIRKQDNEKRDYYFDGLSFEEMDVDGDSEPEVLVRIDGGVHFHRMSFFRNPPLQTARRTFLQVGRNFGSHGFWQFGASNVAARHQHYLAGETSCPSCREEISIWLPLINTFLM